MASFSVKFVLFLLIVAPCVCSAFSFSELFLTIGRLFGKSKPNPPFFRDVGEFHTLNLPKVIPMGNQLPKDIPMGNMHHEVGEFHHPPEDIPIRNKDHGVGEFHLPTECIPTGGVKTFGIKLAKRFFGPDGAKGFRTGYKWGKRYFKLAKRCEKYDSKLTSCPQVTSPMKYKPGCVLQCIVQIGQKTINGNTSDYCNWYTGCPPQEDTCSLTDP